MRDFQGQPRVSHVLSHCCWFGSYMFPLSPSPQHFPFRLSPGVSPYRYLHLHPLLLLLPFLFGAELVVLVWCSSLLGVLFLDVAWPSVNPPPTGSPSLGLQHSLASRDTLLLLLLWLPLLPPPPLMLSLSSAHSSANSSCQLLKSLQPSELDPTACRTLAGTVYFLGKVLRSWLFFR